MGRSVNVPKQEVKDGKGGLSTWLIKVICLEHKPTIIPIIKLARKCGCTKGCLEAILQVVQP